MEVSLVAVAPYVGAWIETDAYTSTAQKAEVAPYVGAWIETDNDVLSALSSIVAPYVGAWIETDEISQLNKKYKSHPTWVRGLKQG